MVALTNAQVHVRQQIVDNAGSLPDPKQREIDRLELENAQTELARLSKWVDEFEAAQKKSDEVKLEQLRRDFIPMVKRLRNG